MPDTVRYSFLTKIIDVYGFIGLCKSPGLLNSGNIPKDRNTFSLISAWVVLEMAYSGCPVRHPDLRQGVQQQSVPLAGVLPARKSGPAPMPVDPGDNCLPKPEEAVAPVFEIDPDLKEDLRREGK
jgi:hypothetical protein